MRLPLAVFGILAAVFVHGPAMAAGAGDDSCVINIQVENDLFGSGADNHYTHGFRASYLFPLRTQGRQRDCIPFEDAFRTVAETASDPFKRFLAERTNRISLILGQSIFTPDDIENPNLIPDDRPYAGWLYVGAGLESSSGGEGRPFLEKFEINLGMVGPASLAEEVQTKWHALIDTRTPRGWDHQLKNEPGLVLSYERKWPFRKALGGGYDAELAPSAGLTLGNIYTYGAAGAMARIGHNVPDDYGPPRIRPGLQGSDTFAALPGREGAFGWYLFAGFEGRAVARNIFLDGNSFADSHSVDKRPLVGDLQVGLVATYGPARLGFTNVFRTREFRGQDKIDEFGSITLSVRF